MRELLQMLLRPMNNDRGNAVAIVLLVLAVVSLIGAGMLTQSKIDLKFATSYKSHSTAFNLADGAASLAFTRVSFSMAPPYDGHSAPTLLNAQYSDPQFARTAGTPSGSQLKDRGTYWPLMIFEGPITDPTKLVGQEIGREGRSLECWTAQGCGKRQDTTGLAVTDIAASNTDVREGKHLPSETSVQIATHKFPPM
ncbi:MAG: hypothetical protein WBG50_01225 [Desulfomonilaceae bacterium]